MSTGSTPIEAMVSDAPTSDIPPNVIATAASATASGSSRSRARKTIPSVSAITTSAATSSVTIDRVIDELRSLTTTGAPVTTYVPLPFGSFHWGIATARLTWRIASARWESERPARRRTWMSELFLLGKM